MIAVRNPVFIRAYTHGAFADAFEVDVVNVLCLRLLFCVLESGSALTPKLLTTIGVVRAEVSEGFKSFIGFAEV